jgi:hypothetical protein
LITVVVAVISYFFIPASLDTAKFLSAEEKQELKTLLRKDSDSADNEAFNWHGVKAALLDAQCWGYAMLFHTHSFSLYSISLFAPTLIKELGFLAWKAQLLSTPPYALAFICTMATAYASYKVKRRAAFIILWDVVIIIGYIIMISTVQPAASYVGLFLIIAGIYSANALVLSWPSENISSQTKRATALGMQISIGNLGAITSTMIYVSLYPLSLAVSSDHVFNFSALLPSPSLVTITESPTSSRLAILSAQLLSQAPSGTSFHKQISVGTSKLD